MFFLQLPCWEQASLSPARPHICPRLEGLAGVLGDAPEPAPHPKEAPAASPLLLWLQSLILLPTSANYNRPMKPIKCILVDWIKGKCGAFLLYFPCLFFSILLYFSVLGWRLQLWQPIFYDLFLGFEQHCMFFHPSQEYHRAFWSLSGIFEG